MPIISVDIKGVSEYVYINNVAYCIILFVYAICGNPYFQIIDNNKDATDPDRTVLSGIISRVDTGIYIDTRFGSLLISSTKKGVKRIMLPGTDQLQRFTEENKRIEIKEDRTFNNRAVRQLREYFQGKRKQFTLTLDLEGTEFQKKVLEAVREVPYGTTQSYKYIAESIGNPKAVRAVGNANRTNPLPILIPCHRIIGSDGSLTGFGGGIELKRKLLEFEKGYR